MTVDSPQGEGDFGVADDGVQIRFPRQNQRFGASRRMIPRV